MDLQKNDFPPDGCPVIDQDGTVCGETRTLNIIQEFKRLYKEKMQEIDQQTDGGGDNLQEKLKLQEQWINDLTDQNEMLVKAVEELEVEAAQRVNLLEEKLQQSAKCICEVMKKYREHDFTSDLLDEPLQKLFYKENDLKNLLLYLKRIRETGDWSVDGLTFYDVTRSDLLGQEEEESSKKDEENPLERESEEKMQQKVSEKERIVEDLKCRLDYNKDLAMELKRKSEELESVKLAMADIRQVLTEEVAAKHDVILSLKKDCAQLEERCQVAAKQVTFKDDIIKELRKEIKQLKQQGIEKELSQLSNEKRELEDKLARTVKFQEEQLEEKERCICDLKGIIDNLKKQAQENKEHYEKCLKVCKICKDKLKVGFTQHDEKATLTENTDSNISGKKLATILNQEETIRLQNETIQTLQSELQSLKLKEQEMKYQCNKWQEEVNCLRSKITEMEIAVENAKERSENLQSAVDLYMNSINVLEASEERFKMEIEQQKLTISNLQEALVNAKQELDDLKQKSSEHLEQLNGIVNILYVILADVEEKRCILNGQFEDLQSNYKSLQHFNYDLEVEYCNKLQDLQLVEMHLSNYKSYLRQAEEENKLLKIQIKKLVKNKKAYQEVVNYFKEEMKALAQQLHELQEILTLQNASAQQETNTFMCAYSQLQNANEQLYRHLSATEEQLRKQMSINRLNEKKVAEMQCLICCQEHSSHNEAKTLEGIKKTLAESLGHNEALQKTIADLNKALAQLQNGFKTYEEEQLKNRSNHEMCQSKINVCRQKLNELKTNFDLKTNELQCLETAYSNQCETLKMAQMELQQIKENQKEKQCHLKTMIEDLQNKLLNSEHRFGKLTEEYMKVQEEMSQLKRNDASKQLEVKKCRSIICQLKKNLVEINQSLNNEIRQQTCANEKCVQNMQLIDEANQSDSEPSTFCSCEPEFYKSIVETLRRSLREMKKQLAEMENKYDNLQRDNEEKQRRIDEMIECRIERDKDYNDLIRKLNEMSKKDVALQEYVHRARAELEMTKADMEKRTKNLEENKKKIEAEHSCKCIELAHAQEENNILKSRLSTLLQRQCELEEENKNLQFQCGRLQNTLLTMESTSHLIKSQVDQYLAEIEKLKSDKETLTRKNQVLLYELHSLQNSMTQTDSQRYINDIKSLESELEEIRSSRDEICYESRNVLSNVKAWLHEQKRINDHAAKRERDYCDTIKRLKEENEELTICKCKHSQTPKKSQHCEKPDCPVPIQSIRLTCQSPWSLGSQGSTSMRDFDSPCSSPCSAWYSGNFKNETEDSDSGSDANQDVVSKLNNMSEQVRQSHRIWKNKKWTCVNTEGKKN